MDHLFLVGFMGVGKTTIGERLAERMQREFKDSDAIIEQQFEMTAADIFRIHGEAHFRESEKQVIRELSMSEKPFVISLGGGAFIQEEVRETCLASGIVVFLELSWEAWVERLDLLIDTRPLLQKRSLEEVKALYISRKPYYEQSHLIVQTDGKTPDESVDELLRGIENWRLHRPLD